MYTSKYFRSSGSPRIWFNYFMNPKPPHFVTIDNTAIGNYRTNPEIVGPLSVLRGATLIDSIVADDMASSISEIEQSSVESSSSHQCWSAHPYIIHTYPELVIFCLYAYRRQEKCTIFIMIFSVAQYFQLQTMEVENKLSTSMFKLTWAINRSLLISGFIFHLCFILWNKMVDKMTLSSFASFSYVLKGAMQWVNVVIVRYRSGIMYIVVDTYFLTSQNICLSISFAIIRKMIFTSNCCKNKQQIHTQFFLVIC